MQNIYKLTLVAVCFLGIVSVSGFVLKGFEMEPKSLREIIDKKSSIVSDYRESRTFIITKNDSLFLDKKPTLFPEWGVKQVFISVRNYASPPPCNIYQVRIDKTNPISYWIYVSPVRSFSNTLTTEDGLGADLLSARLGHSFSNTLNATTAMAKYPSPVRPDSSRIFFNSFWKNEAIGIFSFEFREGNMEKHATYSVQFFSGNTKVFVFSPYLDTRVAIVNNKLDCDKLCQLLETPLDPDPREIAWRIDQYLKGDPLKDVAVAEKQKLKTLEISFPNNPEAEFVQGKEYPIEFPRKSVDGTIPAEIRLVVSRGEVQQVIEPAPDGKMTSPNPATLAPEIDGKYTVLFGQPEKQSLKCYHIDEAGKCLAWGEAEVTVKSTEK